MIGEAAADFCTRRGAERDAEGRSSAATEQLRVILHCAIPFLHARESAPVYILYRVGDRAAQTLGQVIFQNAAGGFAPAQRQAAPAGNEIAGKGAGDGFAAHIGQRVCVRKLDSGKGRAGHGQMMGRFKPPPHELCQHKPRGDRFYTA